MNREPGVEENAAQATKGKLNMALPKRALKKPPVESTKTKDRGGREETVRVTLSGMALDRAASSATSPLSHRQKRVASASWRGGFRERGTGRGRAPKGDGREGQQSRPGANPGPQGYCEVRAGAGELSSRGHRREPAGPLRGSTGGLAAPHLTSPPTGRANCPPTQPPHLQGVQTALPGGKACRRNVHT